MLISNFSIIFLLSHWLIFILKALLKKKAESGETLGKKIIPGHVAPKVTTGKKLITSSQTTWSTVQTKIPEKVNAKTETATKLKPILKTKQQNKKEEERRGRNP